MSPRSPSYAGEGPAWDRTYGKSIDEYYERRWSTPVDAGVPASDLPAWTGETGPGKPKGP